MTICLILLALGCTGFLGLFIFGPNSGQGWMG